MKEHHMTKTYLSVSADYTTGEAELTKGTKFELEDLIRENPLLAADILKDCIHDFSELYKRAAEAMDCDFDLKRAMASHD